MLRSRSVNVRSFNGSWGVVGRIFIGRRSIHG
jgi:hypothetical protein